VIRAVFAEDSKGVPTHPLAAPIRWKSQTVYGRHNKLVATQPQDDSTADIEVEHIVATDVSEWGMEGAAESSSNAEIKGNDSWREMSRQEQQVSPKAPAETAGTLSTEQWPGRPADRLQTLTTMIAELARRFDGLETSVTRAVETVEARVTIVEGRLRFLENHTQETCFHSTPDTFRERSTRFVTAQPHNATSVGEVIADMQTHTPETPFDDVHMEHQNNAGVPKATEQLIIKMQDRFKETHELLQRTNFNTATATQERSPMSVLNIHVLADSGISK